MTTKNEAAREVRFVALKLRGKVRAIGQLYSMQQVRAKWGRPSRVRVSDKWTTWEYRFADETYSIDFDRFPSGNSFAMKITVTSRQRARSAS